ncbi:C-type lectin domain family 4 member E-like [Triplophysa dalaica]|uniref:C-type lectin domain family 4 member E-like n=1 Tax=Triplophysa dalaica TaxID=1582913 RepID=UPI0024DFF5E2|nr:C-type lectin domain family 4 member E-like [Triplophysa dalaica]XP_056597368.1 C-type lectin domain family 4 member E-like [Triplophysa dalaica]XP_056597369.1 C-type lectin domain family 4 member E-like [Triplophysa dalaica]
MKIPATCCALMDQDVDRFTDSLGPCFAMLFHDEASTPTPVHVTTQSTPGQVTAKDSCPSDWHYFSGSCYFISVDSEDWPDSQAFCKHRGGHLAIIHTPEEQTFIWDLLPRGHWNAYWIGISDEKVEDDWYWVDGTKLVGGFWEDGEPNNHDEDEDCCYMVKTEVLSRIATKSWYDAPCYMFRRRICEKEIDASS